MQCRPSCLGSEFEGGRRGEGEGRVGGGEGRGEDGRGGEDREGREGGGEGRGGEREKKRNLKTSKHNRSNIWARIM